MNFFSRGIVVTIGFLLLILLVIIISLALVLGIAMGLGWLVLLFLPFTLFEATLLVLVAFIPVGFFWYNIMVSISDFAAEPYDDYEEYEIPATRFFETEQDKTWEAWFRFQIANSIYDEFQISPQPVAPMGDKQLQELAIRLADTAMSLLKSKTTRAKRLTITLNALKRQMTKAGQRPYDDDILRLAVEAINDTLDFQEEVLRHVIQHKLWNSRYELF